MIVAKHPSRSLLPTRYLVAEPESKGRFVSRERDPLDRHRLECLEMPGGKLEGFVPNLLVKVALASH